MIFSAAVLEMIFFQAVRESDSYVFDSLLDEYENVDSLIDFTANEDRIVLSRTIFASLVAEGVLLEDNFCANASGEAADDNDYIVYNTTTGSLLYDVDGNGSGVAVEFANLTAKPEITNSDFMIAA